MIPGDPDAVEAAAAAVGTAGERFLAARDSVVAHAHATAAEWTGSAADAALDKLLGLGNRVLVGHDVCRGAAPVLREYAAQLRIAQRQFTDAQQQKEAGHAQLDAAGSGASPGADAARAQATATMAGADAAMADAQARAAAANAAAAAQINSLAAQLAQMQLKASGLAALAAAGLIPLLGSLSPDAELARLREMLARGELTPEEFARALEAYWTRQALARAGINPSLWDPSAGTAANQEIIAQVYRYYGDLYLQHPYLQWAGMANMIGPSFAAGFFDLEQLRRAAGLLSRLPAGVGPGQLGLRALAGISAHELRFYETTLLEMQREIFFDQAPMHEAYLAGGMPAIREMGRAGIINARTVQAWQQIDEGRRTGDQELVASGNEYLLRREQFDIIADDYDRMREHFPSGGAFTYTAMTFAGQPSIPGARSYADVFPLTVSAETPGPERLGYPDNLGPVPLPGGSVTVDNPAQGRVIVETPLPDGNISDRHQRWNLIEQDTLPAYQELITEDPERAREIIATPVPERIDDYRLEERLDDLEHQLLDWDARFEQ